MTAAETRPLLARAAEVGRLRAELDRRPDERPHTWPCSCPYCAAMARVDDGVEPDVWEPYY